jgi:hypothetical protein
VKRDPHTSACERHTLAHADHAPMGDGPMDVLLASAKSRDGGEHSGEARVTRCPAEEHKSSFEKLDPNS